MVWLSSVAVAVSVLAVLGLLSLLGSHAAGHFWPRALVAVQIQNAAAQQAVLGEVVSVERVRASQLREAGIAVPAEREWVQRSLIKRGNRDRYGSDFIWLVDNHITARSNPSAAVTLERLEWGNQYGYLTALQRDGVELDLASEQVRWEKLQHLLAQAAEVRARIAVIEREQIAALNYELERLRLQSRADKLSAGQLNAQQQTHYRDAVAQLRAELTLHQREIGELHQALARDTYTLRFSDGQEQQFPVAKVLRAYRANNMGTLDKLGVFAQRLWEFVSTEPREANTEGGVFPAIFGTVMMVLLMSVVVTPFGVIAAVYLHEYASQDVVTRLVRTAVNNLAGVPSIVYGVFGLGFFVYFLGGNIDRLFYPAALPSPTFGTGGLMWASLTLALLTLPVVIVATEEGLARIPRSLREGSMALGATRFETLWRVVLPMASPAMMTGLILAVARAAGEVAPLMLVGVVKLAPSLPVDGNYPYLHLEQKFMHLGFHIYDVGFQSPNIEAARSLVFATAFLLVVIIAALNLVAVRQRNRLRERYKGLET